MSRSNIYAFKIGTSAVDSGLTNSKLNSHDFTVSMEQGINTASDSTLVPDDKTSASKKWNDFAESFSGRYSTHSWGADEADFEKEVAEIVLRKFETIDNALYDGKSTGNVQVDEECDEWSSKFPHIMVNGLHLLDSIDDGTDMIDPDPFLVSEVGSESVIPSENSPDLVVVGKHLEPEVPHDTIGYTHLYEEVLATEGILEEYFAFDKSVDESLSESFSINKLKHNGLPPLTPNAAVKDTVCNLVFDQIWNEIVAMLQPLVSMMKKRSSAYGRDPLGNVSLPPLADPEGSNFLHQQPYMLRGLRDPATLTKETGPSGAKFLRFKHSGSNLPTLGATLPQISSNLSGVMQIRSVSLQHRIPSMVADISRDGTPAFGRPGTSTGRSYGPKSNTPIPPRLSEFQLPGRPGSRLMSSRLTNRRNVTLKPIDRPKTPGLEPIENCVRGYKLSTNVSVLSPPSTPITKNNQLPPLETSVSSAINVNNTNSYERSPPSHARINARDKNRVTFNSRIVSAADIPDTWKNKYSTSDDLRPSTSTSCRQDGPSRVVGRKLSDHTMQYYGKMKIVRHAPCYSGVLDRTENSASKERVTSSIAEGDERVNPDTPAFAITGTAGFIQSRPSAKGKLKGHVR